MKIISIIFMLGFFFLETESFSYNTFSKIVYNPSYHTNNHSYFGYTTILKNGPNPYIVVGAPRDTSYYNNHANINDPGAIYLCYINFQEQRTFCNQKIVDTSGNTRQHLANGKSYHHRKDNMWLGMSMTGTENDTRTVLCAPRWINQFYEDIYFMNGLCYGVSDISSSRSETQVLLPMVNQYSQGYTLPMGETIETYNSQVYLYAHGQAGFSSAFSNDATELLLGAPGTYVWAGSVIKYEIAKYIGRDRYSQQIIPQPYYSPAIEVGSLLGYSVGIGNFIDKKKKLYVAGAPKGAEFKGTVIIFDFPYRSAGSLNVLARLNGTQMGEYFGSVIATVDINQDGLTDLIIGAPMYAEKLMKDLGRIYVYINNDEGNFILQENKLCGSFRDGARFGSAISSIGDLNQDGYLDIAVGAPYENYGRGAVYIYLGTADGLNPVYVQRIAIPNTSGFGISISKGVDIDNNTCNDLAIGAHDSASVVFLRCHPSTNINVRIVSIPSELSTNETEFTAQICVQFKGSIYATDLEFNFIIDPEYRRIQFSNENDRTFDVSGKDGSESCKDILLNLKEKDVDYSRPIEIQTIYKLKRNPLTEYEFCPQCTVLRPGGNQKTVLQVPFAAGCGTDSICSPDLKLKVAYLASSPFVIGSAPNISLNISLENLGEPAFLTQTKLMLPKTTPLLRIPSQCYTEESMLICDFGNPLAPKMEKSILVEFDSSHLRNEDEFVIFNITAESAGQEMLPDDNNMVFTLPIKTEAELEVIGNSGSLQYVYIRPKSTNIKNISAIHSYQVINKGPSVLDAITVRFFLPIQWKNSSTGNTFELMKVLTPKATNNNQLMQCTSLSGSFYEIENTGSTISLSNDTDFDITTPTSFTSGDVKTTTTKIENEQLINISDDMSTFDLPNNIIDADYPQSAHINCTDKEHVTCFIVECKSSRFIPGNNGAFVSFQIILNAYNIDLLLNGKKHIIMSSYATVQNEFSNVSKLGSAWEKSLLLGEIPLPPPTPMWIYLLSLLIGILLLIAIAYALHWMGFFKRKTKEEMELLKNQEDSQNGESSENIKQ